MGKFENRLEALVYLILRDYVKIGDFNKLFNDIMQDQDFQYDKNDHFITYVKSKLELMKNG